MSSRGGRTTDRGVSVALNYVITLGITTLLVTGLLYAAGDVVEDRRESAARAELRVVGEQVAYDLTTADRLAQSGGDVVEVDSESPPQVAGNQYTVSLNSTSQELVLETWHPDVVVYVPVGNVTPIATSDATGGDVQIVLLDGTLEVRGA